MQIRVNPYPFVILTKPSNQLLPGSRHRPLARDSVPPSLRLPEPRVRFELVIFWTTGLALVTKSCPTVFG